MADPNKWLGLMKWSMKYADGTAPSEFKAMSKEDRDFLDKVLKEGVMDENERVGQILRILDGESPDVVFAKEDDDEQSKPEEKPSEEDLAEYKDALLDELLSRVDQIDMAMNFVKLEGLPVLIRLMQKNPRASTRALAAEVCSVVVQNNPFCQDGAVAVGMVEELCKLSEDPDTTCQVKALLAISCLVRNHPASEQRFFSPECSGLSVLKRFLREDADLRLQRKSLFFLRYLIRNNAETAKQVLADGKYLSTVAKLMNTEDVDLCESTIDALTEFLQLGGKFADAVRSPELALQDVLTARVQQVKAMDDSNEEKEYMQEVVRMATELKQQLLQAP
ncbi:TPA: hypothetical protein N0F65_011782 [Lagenidium giganteum]|uniref:Uncharacterized protein n=1 Tax=Lagenidium giganteum TaxID=4803 RepID=A0AAV2YJY2_9STRA|nr:TPA: hypothetical protein N0F65_011782 [Lagenidium giganteum]